MSLSETYEIEICSNLTDKFKVVYQKLSVSDVAGPETKVRN